MCLAFVLPAVFTHPFDGRRKIDLFEFKLFAASIACENVPVTDGIVPHGTPLGVFTPLRNKVGLDRIPQLFGNFVNDRNMTPVFCVA